MDIIGIGEFRTYGEPEPPKRPRKSLRESKPFRALTFGVMIFAILWIIGIGIGLHPSKITFVGFMAALVFYSGEYIAWERPRIRNRKPRERKARHQRRGQ